MSKRLQVLLDEAELRAIRRIARARRMTVAEWVRVRQGSGPPAGASLWETPAPGSRASGRWRAMPQDNTMPKLRHIALGPQAVETTAKFYIEVFGIKEIPRIDDPGGHHGN